LWLLNFLFQYNYIIDRTVLKMFITKVVRSIYCCFLFPRTLRHATHGEWGYSPGCLLLPVVREQQPIWTQRYDDDKGCILPGSQQQHKDQEWKTTYHLWTTKIRGIPQPTRICSVISSHCSSKLCYAKFKICLYGL
jgi:hypothetical protein